MDNQKEIDEITKLIFDYVDRLVGDSNILSIQVVSREGQNKLGLEDDETYIYGIAEELVSVGIGDIKQAVREFAERLKSKLQTDIADFKEFRKCTDDTIILAQCNRAIDTVENTIGLIDELVKEVCGE